MSHMLLICTKPQKNHCELLTQRNKVCTLFTIQNCWVSSFLLTFSLVSCYRHSWDIQSHGWTCWVRQSIDSPSCDLHSAYGSWDHFLRRCWLNLQLSCYICNRAANLMYILQVLMPVSAEMWEMFMEWPQIFQTSLWLYILVCCIWLLDLSYVLFIPWV